MIVDLKIKAIFILFTTICLFNSCDSFDSSGHLVGRYYLQTNEFGKSICYKVDDVGCLELVDGTFERIAYDEHYIIIKRSEYQYLIVTVFKDFNYFPEKGVFGPLTLKEFLKMKKSLKINVDIGNKSN